MAVNQFNKRKTELLCQDSTGVNNSGYIDVNFKEQNIES